MGKAEADAWAVENGYETTEELHMSNGGTVYLLQPKDGALIGIPRYIRETELGFVVSTDDESMALFDEPDYMGEDDA